MHEVAPPKCVVGIHIYTHKPLPKTSFVSQSPGLFSHRDLPGLVLILSVQFYRLPIPAVAIPFLDG